ncbi:MAG TPA: hypothetical protein VK619_01680 [Pyrinomonadaceae bacterium]|nr:hypothetical protein [Pyrinomonadaceae bacterium]
MRINGKEYPLAGDIISRQFSIESNKQANKEVRPLSTQAAYKAAS